MLTLKKKKNIGEETEDILVRKNKQNTSDNE